MPVTFDPSLPAALGAVASGPLRIQVRGAWPGNALEPGLRRAAEASGGEARLVGSVGEVVVTPASRPADVDAVLAALVHGLESAGVQEAVLMLGDVDRPVVARRVATGLGPSRAANGLAEAVASAYERAGESALARRAREQAAGAGADDAAEPDRRRLVLGLLLRTWLPIQLQAAGADRDAAPLAALPDPATDAGHVLDLVGRAVLAASAHAATAPRPLFDIEPALAVGRDLDDVIWGCAGASGRAGEAVAHAGRDGRAVADPGRILWAGATVAAVGGLFDEVAAAGDLALERWQHLRGEDHTFRNVVTAVLDAPPDGRFAVLDRALSGTLAGAPAEAERVLRRELAAAGDVAWALAITTGWEAASVRCCEAVARRAADGLPIGDGRPAAVGAVAALVRPLADAGAALLARIA